MARSISKPLRFGRISKTTIFFLLPAFVIAFIADALFAYNATISDPLNPPAVPSFQVSPEYTVFVLHLLSVVVIFISVAINNIALSTIRWAFATNESEGLPLLTFIALSPATQIWGLIRLFLWRKNHPSPGIRCYTRRHWWLLSRY
jgi:hypothetical protein